MSNVLFYKQGSVTIDENTVPVTVGNPETSDFACVVEVKHGERYNVPHFIFFADKTPNEFSVEDTERIYAACVDAWPNFSQIIEDEVICVPGKPGVYSDRHGNPKTEEDFLRDPWIGIFLMDPQCKGDDLPCGYSIAYKDEETRLSLQERIMGYRYG